MWDEKKRDNPYNVVAKQTKELSMDIISQLSLDYSKKILRELNTLIPQTSYSENSFTYVDMISHIDKFSRSFNTTIIKTYLEKEDLKYRNSNQRITSYHVKVTRERTIKTIFGDVTYKRTIYSDKSTKKTYCYIDRVIGIPRYDYYDSTIKSLVYELSADQNSMIKVGKLIGDRIAPYSNNFRTSSKNSFKAISRQTVSNIVNKYKDVKISYKRKRTPKKIYIMADEKYVYSQVINNKGFNKKSMVKLAVIFEGEQRLRKVDGTLTKKYTLVNKHYIATIKDSIWDKVYEELDQIYNIEEIKEIIILGDGGSWIKSGVRELTNSNYKIHFALDKFHFNQSLVRITRNSDIRKKLSNYVLNDRKDDFKVIVDSLLEESKNNEKKQKRIENQYKYIKNNWKAILSMYNDVKIGCAMEQEISHTLAAIYSNLGKGYSTNKLETYIELRIKYMNKLNLQEIYLKALNNKPNKKNVIEIKEVLDFSMFDKTNSLILNINENVKRSFLKESKKF